MSVVKFMLMTSTVIPEKEKLLYTLWGVVFAMQPRALALCPEFKELSCA